MLLIDICSYRKENNENNKRPLTYICNISNIIRTSKWPLFSLEITIKIFFFHNKQRIISTSSVGSLYTVAFI